MMKYAGLKALISGLALAVAGVSFAAYPDKPLQLIVPYPPGGFTDAIARAVAKPLSDRLQQPVVIVNLPGGGGNIAAAKAAKSPADGYTLYIGNNATITLNTLVYKALTFDPLADLAPVALIGESHAALVVNPSLPVQNVAELIAYARARPGQLNFASTGTGGVSHLAGELLKSANGVKMTHVPYKGTAPATTDLVGGQIQLMFNDAATSFIKAEKLRALAVTGTKRQPQLPDVPTLAEAGVPGFETYAWFGIFVPTGTPAAVITRLNRELVQITQDPAMQKWAQSQQAEAISSSPEEATAYIRRDLAKWTRVVKEVGLVPE